MSKFSTYDPEDIEKLMLNKSFDELYDKEKEFVLRHIDSEEEYEQMRQVLLEVKASEDFDEIIEPPAYMRKQLIEEFEAQKRHNPLLLLFQQIQAVFKMPAFQIGFATVSVFLFVMILVKFNNKSDNIELAQNKNVETETLSPTSTITEPATYSESEFAEETTMEDSDIEENITKETMENKDDNAHNFTQEETFTFGVESDFMEEENVSKETDKFAFVNKPTEGIEEAGKPMSNRSLTSGANSNIVVEDETTINTSNNKKNIWKRKNGNSFFVGTENERKSYKQKQIITEGSSLETNKEVFFGIMYAAM